MTTSRRKQRFFHLCHRYKHWLWAGACHLLLILVLLINFSHETPPMQSLHVKVQSQPTIVQASLVSLPAVVPPKHAAKPRPVVVKRKIHLKPKPKRIKKPKPTVITKPKHVTKPKVDRHKLAIERLKKLSLSSLDHAVSSDLAAQQAKTAIDKYRALIQQVVRGYWINQADDSNLHVTILIHMDRHGDVLSTSIVSSSGSAAFDRQVVIAVQKSSPLPVPKDPVLAQRFQVIKMQFSSGGSQ